MPNVLDDQCIKCGYDLAGLPYVGRCPECGNPYDASRRVGVRNPRDTPDRVRADVLLGRTMRIAVGVLFLVLAGLCVASGMALQWFTGTPRGLGISIVLAMVLLLAAVVTLLGLRREAD